LNGGFQRVAIGHKKAAVYICKRRPGVAITSRF